MFDITIIDHHDLLEINHDGFLISKSDAKYLINCQKKILEDTDRVIINYDILKNIILTFKDNSYDDITDISSKMLTIFFEMKNNTRDLIDDDMLIKILFDIYEHYVYGCVELMDNYLDQIIEYVNVHKKLEGFEYVRY